MSIQSVRKKGIKFLHQLLIRRHCLALEESNKLIEFRWHVVASRIAFARLNLSEWDEVGMFTSTICG